MGLFGDMPLADPKVVEAILKEAGAVPIPELVRQVHAGNSSSWHEAGTLSQEVASDQQELSQLMGEALSGLESTWTGGGADAASARFKPAVEATDTASQAFNANASQVTNTAYEFENLRSKLTPIENQAPERDALDVLTPWDTDSEDKINQYKAQLDQNRQTYQAYEQNVSATAGSMQTDYGKLGDSGFGDFTIDKSGTNGGDDKNSTGVITFDESGSQSSDQASGQQSAQIGGPQSVTAQTATGPGSSSSYTPNLPGPSTGDDSTQTSSYTAPAASTSNYQPPGYNPGGAGFGANSGGGNTSYTPPGYGAVSGSLGLGSGSGSSTGSGGRFSAGGLGSGAGTGSGSGSGGLSGRGAGGTTGGPTGMGKGTGAGPLGAGGQAAANAAGASTGGTAGRGGMGAMGGAGAGAGKGKGSEDEEHQRRYVENTDEAFSLTDGEDVLRDPETGNVVTPPTIGG